MSLTKETESTAKRIGELYSILKEIDTTSKIAKKINDILIYGEQVSIPVLRDAWDYFAYKKGITKSLDLEVNA